MNRSGRCQYCQKNHLLKRCPDFRWMLPEERRDTAKKLQMCLNCLSDWHQRTNCTSASRCKVCSHRHHTMLHHEDIDSSSSSLDSERPKSLAVKDLKGYSIKALTRILPNTTINFHAIITEELTAKPTAKPVSAPIPGSSQQTATTHNSDTNALNSVPKLSKLELYTKEINPVTLLHGPKCKTITPVILCTLGARKKRVTVTLALNPNVLSSQIMFEMVEGLPYKSKLKKGVPFGEFEVITSKQESWVQKMVIIDRLRANIAVAVNDPLLPFILDISGINREKWAHPMPHDFGPIHGVIGSDYYNKVINDKWARLPNYPSVKVQLSKFGVVVSGCLCDPSNSKPRNMLNP